MNARQPLIGFNSNIPVKLGLQSKIQTIRVREYCESSHGQFSNYNDVGLQLADFMPCACRRLCCYCTHCGPCTVVCLPPIAHLGDRWVISGGIGCLPAATFPDSEEEDVNMGTSQEHDQKQLKALQAPIPPADPQPHTAQPPAQSCLDDELMPDMSLHVTEHLPRDVIAAAGCGIPSASLFMSLSATDRQPGAQPHATSSSPQPIVEIDGAHNAEDDPAHDSHHSFMQPAAVYRATSEGGIAAVEPEQAGYQPQTTQPSAQPSTNLQAHPDGQSQRQKHVNQEPQSDSFHEPCTDAASTLSPRVSHGQHAEPGPEALAPPMSKPTSSGPKINHILCRPVTIQQPKPIPQQSDSLEQQQQLLTAQSQLPEKLVAQHQGVFCENGRLKSNPRQIQQLPQQQPLLQPLAQKLFPALASQENVALPNQEPQEQHPAGSAGHTGPSPDLHNLQPESQWRPLCPADARMFADALPIPVFPEQGLSSPSSQKSQERGTCKQPALAATQALVQEFHCCTSSQQDSLLRLRQPIQEGTAAATNAKAQQAGSLLPALPVIPIAMTQLHRTPADTPTALCEIDPADAEALTIIALQQQQQQQQQPQELPSGSSISDAAGSILMPPAQHSTSPSGGSAIPKSAYIPTPQACGPGAIGKAALQTYTEPQPDVSRATASIVAEAQFGSCLPSGQKCQGITHLDQVPASSEPKTPGSPLTSQPDVQATSDLPQEASRSQIRRSLHSLPILLAGRCKGNSNGGDPRANGNAALPQSESSQRSQVKEDRVRKDQGQQPAATKRTRSPTKAAGGHCKGKRPHTAKMLDPHPRRVSPSPCRAPPQPSTGEVESASIPSSSLPAGTKPRPAQSKPAHLCRQPRPAWNSKPQHGSAYDPADRRRSPISNHGGDGPHGPALFKGSYKGRETSRWDSGNQFPKARRAKSPNGRSSDPLADPPRAHSEAGAEQKRCRLHHNESSQPSRNIANNPGMVLCLRIWCVCVCVCVCVARCSALLCRTAPHT